jgi:glycosylphosphatidylinositol transamidase (GPIT) subunit GPI8
MLTLIHKECGGPALEPNSSVGEVYALPIDRFPFLCFTCLEEIVDESEVRLSGELESRSGCIPADYFPSVALRISARKLSE